MLRYIHLHLQEIKSNNLPFGGVNIIAVGDLYRLKPVMGQFMDRILQNIWTEWNNATKRR